MHKLMLNVAALALAPHLAFAQGIPPAFSQFFSVDYSENFGCTGEDTVVTPQQYTPGNGATLPTGPFIITAAYVMIPPGASTSSYIFMGELGHDPSHPSFDGLVTPVLTGSGVTGWSGLAVPFAGSGGADQIHIHFSCPIDAQPMGFGLAGWTIPPSSFVFPPNSPFAP